MARNMILAQETLFAKLEEFCVRRQVLLSKPGRKRYVAGDDVTDSFIQDLAILEKLEFGIHRAVMLMEMGDVLYIGTIGFNLARVPEYWVENDVNSGVLVTMLSESAVQPTALPIDVMNRVEVADMSDGDDYDGHCPDSIASLFPVIRLFEASEPIERESIWSTFFSLCLSECTSGSSWIQEGLASELDALCGLRVASMPYRALCQSVFDMDPRGMFMALYRCLEMTYAYEACRKLSLALPTPVPWVELAGHLGESLSWRPREKDSLKAVLGYATEEDLEQVCSILGRGSVESGDKSLVGVAGSEIYTLRNRIVHFGFNLEPVEMRAEEWNLLCGVMVGIVFDVFATAFPDPRRSVE